MTDFEFGYAQAALEIGAIYLSHLIVFVFLLGVVVINVHLLARDKRKDFEAEIAVSKKYRSIVKAGIILIFIAPIFTAKFYLDTPVGNKSLDYHFNSFNKSKNESLGFLIVAASADQKITGLEITVLRKYSKLKTASMPESSKKLNSGVLLKLN